MLQWLVTHEKRLIAVFVCILAICGSFLFGVYHGRAMIYAPLTIVRASGNGMPEKTQQELASDQTEKELSPSDCKFVGSSKGAKYYPPTCSYAKKISKENLRCFVSAQDAEEQGYTLSTSCK